MQTKGKKKRKKSGEIPSHSPNPNLSPNHLVNKLLWTTSTLYGLFESCYVHENGIALLGNRKYINPLST